MPRMGQKKNLPFSQQVLLSLFINTNYTNIHELVCTNWCLEVALVSYLVYEWLFEQLIASFYEGGQFFAFKEVLGELG